MRFKTYILLLISAASLFCACHKTHTEEAQLSFGVEVTELKAEAGSIKTDNAKLKDNPFGVAGLVYADAEGTSAGENVFLTERVNVGWTGSSWEYSPLRYWQINKFYRFRAYHPYEGSAINVQHADGNRLTVEYSVVAGQQDLLVGFTSLQATADKIKTRVPIVFKHALCGLQFNIAFKDVPDISDDEVDKIKSFYMSGIIPIGTMIYSHEDGNPHEDKIEWHTLSFAWDDSDFFNWESAVGKEFKKINDEKDNATIIFDQDGMVFCVPQVCSASPEMPTKVYFTTEAAGDALHIGTLPKTNWEAGKIYVYTLLINKSDIEISLSIKPWTEIESNETIYL